MGATVELTSQDLAAILDLIREISHRRTPSQGLGMNPIETLGKLKAILTAEEFESVRKAYVAELVGSP
jgi:hypothetical protein